MSSRPSAAESRLLALIRKARLRAPQTNVRLHGYGVDFLWAAEKFVVEVDAGSNAPVGKPELLFTDPRYADTPGWSHAIMPGVTWSTCRRRPRTSATTCGWCRRG